MPTNHTPGPWHIGTNSSTGIDVLEVYGRHGNLCVAAGFGNGPEAEANARLMAKAPELLAFANKVRIWLISPDLSPATLREIEAEALALCAKVKGESHAI